MKDQTAVIQTMRGAVQVELFTQMEVEGGKDDNDNNNNNDDNDDNTDDDDKINASLITTSNKTRKYNTITPGDDDDMAKSNMAKLYPHLLRALGVGEDGFNPTNPSVQKSVRSRLSELNDLLSTAYQLDISGLSNKRISYVRVPQTKSNRSFQNTKEWVDTAIQIADSKHSGTFKPAYHITYYIIHYYHDSFLAACKTQQVPVCKLMSATQFQPQNLPMIVFIASNIAMCTIAIAWLARAGLSCSPNTGVLSAEKGV